MAISLGGLMRGALPVLSERIAAKPEDTENRLNALGEVFSNLAPAYEQKVAEAQKENEKITQLAGMTGVPEDIAYDLLKKHNGDVLKAEVDAAKLMKAYKDKPIPTIKVDSATDDKSTDTVSSINITSDKKGKENIISNFSQLFKFHTQDEIIDIFAKQNNLSPDKVKSIIFNTFKLPSYAPTTTLATEAYGAIRDYKEPEPVDKLAGIKVNVDFLKGFLSSKSQMELLKNESDKTLISDIVRTYGNLVQKQAEVGVGNLKPEDLEMIQTMLEAVPTDFIKLPVPPEEKLDVSKILQGFNTRVDAITKLSPDDLVFGDMTKDKAFDIQNQITPLYGNIQDKLQNKEGYDTSEEFTNDKVRLDNLLSQLEKDRKIKPEPAVESAYVDTTITNLQSILNSIDSNFDKYMNPTEARKQISGYLAFMMEEKDKKVGSRNIEEIRKIFNDITTNSLFQRTYSEREIKDIFRTDYKSIYDTATNLARIAADPSKQEFYSPDVLNQMKQFGGQFEQIIRDNFNDKAKLKSAMTALSEEMFLVSPTKPAIPVAEQFQYLESLITSFINSPDKYSENVREQFPMLLPNFNAIKHMTDPEQQKTMFLELEKQAVDILRKRDFPLSAELQAFQTRANTLTANADNPEKSKFYRTNDLEIMKGFSNKFAIIAGMPDGEQKTKMLDELKNSMNSITTANPELIAKENLIQSQSTIKLSQEELTKKAIASLGIENADIQMINNELHIVVPPKNPGDLPTYVALARLNSVGEQVAGNPKVFDAAVKGMNASLDHIAGIADLKAALEKHPDAFNVIGKLYMTATDFADFIRKPEVAEFFGGAEIQKTVAKRIEFVKTVKDQIFDDPRLSDQDLRLIIQYIAVLNDPFIGTSRAFAALNSLEQVMVNSIAKNMFIAKPGLKVTNGRGANGEYLDAYDMDSIGGRTFRALFKRAHPEFTLPNSKEEFLNMPKDQQKFFATRGAIYAIQAENAVGSVNSLATYILKAGGDVNKGLEQHNKNYAYNTTNRGTFNPKNIIAGSGKNRDKLITDLIGTMEPEQVEKLKARLGDNFGIG